MKYLPIQTDLPAAPSQLLDVICCNCKTDYSTKRCTCRKYDMPSTVACGECRGTSCVNSQVPNFNDDVE